MNKNIKYAIGWAVIGIVYLAVGALNFWMHMPVRGAVMAAGGYLISVMFIFQHGTFFGVDKSFDEAERCCEEATRIIRMMREESASQPIWDANEDPPRQIQCRKCGHTEFGRVAGRYVCTCCGEVMEDHGEGTVR